MGEAGSADREVKGLFAMRRSVKASEARAALPAADDDHLIEELRHLKSRRSPRQARCVRATQILEETSSSRVRNAAALALAELRALGAKDALIALLRRPDTGGARGTLLYALAELRAEVPLPILAEIIVDESYEAREEALDFIRSGRFACSASEFIGARTMLEAARPAADDERSQAIRRALDYLGETRAAPP